MATVDGLTRLPVFPSGGAPYPVPIRRQWNSNNGYCGEASLIAAGMSFGQYTSQFTARSLASPGLSQARPEAQLLLGVNEQQAAAGMKLEGLVYSPSKLRRGEAPSGFYGWIRQNVQRGYRVIIGLYMKGRKDPDYDHIVPVLDVDSETQNPPSRRDRKAGGFTFSDHYGSVWHGLNRQVLNTWAMANRRTAPSYSLPDGVVNYGIAISGVCDRDRVTIPVSLTASRPDEPVSLRVPICLPSQRH